MKRAFLLVATAALAAGCGSAPQHPDAVDLAAPSDPSDGCTHFATWPSDHTSAAFRLDPLAGFDAETTLFAVLGDEPGGLTLTFEVGVYHPIGADTTFPHTNTFNETSSISNTNDVATMLVTDGTNDAIYVARAGTMTVDRADRTPGAGTISAHGSGLRLALVAQTFSEEMVYSCYDIDGFSLSAEYFASDDGGSGDADL